MVTAVDGLERVGGAGTRLGLPAGVALRVVAEAFSVERRWIDATRESGRGAWPHGYCCDASYDLWEALEERVPDAGAVYVWGEFRLDPGDWRPRWGVVWRGAGGVGASWTGHAWVELRDGTIVDETVGQFTGGLAVGVFVPGSAARRRYRPVKRGLDR